MPAEIITTEELDSYLASSGFAGMSASDLADAVAAATDKIRQAALNDYTAASFESLTEATVPPVMREQALALAAGVITKGLADRPDSITNAYEEAYRWLGHLANGNTHFEQSTDAVLEKQGAESGARVTYTTRTRKFRRAGDGSRDLDFFDPSIG